MMVLGGCGPSGGLLTIDATRPNKYVERVNEVAQRRRDRDEFGRCKQDGEEKNHQAVT